MPIQKQVEGGGPALSLGTFIFENEEEILPDLAPFIAALEENLETLRYIPPVAPLDGLPVELIHGMKPFFVGERMTVWRVDWAN